MIQIKLKSVDHVLSKSLNFIKKDSNTSAVLLIYLKIKIVFYVFLT